MSKRWGISLHAERRSANRIGLILDLKVRMEIIRILNANEVVVVQRQKSSTLYEINLFGRKVIAACDPVRKSVLTFMDAKAWYRDKATRRVYRKKKKKYLSADEEE